MKKVLSIMLILCMMSINLAMAATPPVKQIGPMTITGTVETVFWTPKRELKSGNRPAQYRVMLNNVTIKSDKDAINPYKDRKNMRLVLDHPENDGFLAPGMKIKVIDYKINIGERGRICTFKNIEKIN